MHFKMSAICFNLDQSKILLSGNGLDQGADWTFSAFCPLSIVCKRQSDLHYLQTQTWSER